MSVRSGLALGLMLTWWLAAPALGQPVSVAASPSVGIDAATAWARDQVAAGKVADFNTKCPPKTDKPAAGDACRTIRATLIQELIRDTPKDAQRRVDIDGAVIEGDIDLADAAFDREVSIKGSLLRGKVDLSRARPLCQ